MGHGTPIRLPACDDPALEPGAYVWRGGEPLLLREGDFRNQAAFLCLDQRLGRDSSATVFLMADLPATLEELGARGYRAAQLEAGTVAGKVYLGSYAHRFGATGLTFFDDEVERFFSPEAVGKSCMLVVALGDSPRIQSRHSCLTVLTHRSANALAFGAMIGVRMTRILPW